MYIITSGITSLILTAYRLYTVCKCIGMLSSSMWTHDLSQAVSCWPLAVYPLRMGLFWTDGALGQVYCGQRGAETGFSPKTSSAFASQYPNTA